MSAVSDNEFWGCQALEHWARQHPEQFTYENPNGYAMRIKAIKVARDNLFAEAVELIDEAQLEEHSRKVQELQAKVDELNEELGIHVNVDLDVPQRPQIINLASTEDFLLGQSNAKAMMTFAGDEDEPWEGNRRMGSL